MKERHTYLFYQDWRSDKVYFVHLIPVPRRATWQVVVYWGRRGRNLNRTVRTGPDPYYIAERDFHRIVREKTAKGYRPGQKPCLTCHRNCACEP